MPCPHCAAPATVEQRRRTALGYRTCRCPACRRAFNERTRTPYTRLQYPTDLVLLVLLWRLRYKLRLRDLAEMFLERGFVFSHEQGNCMSPDGQVTAAYRRYWCRWWRGVGQL